MESKPKDENSKTGAFDALGFIEADVKRGAQNRVWLSLVAMIFVAFVPPLIGLGLRPSGFQVFQPTLAVGLSNLFGSCLLAILIAASFQTQFSSFRWIRNSAVFLVLCLLLSSSRMFTVTAIKIETMSNPDFLSQCLACFIGGSVTCILIGLGLLTMAFVFGSLPTLRFRIILASSAGVAGALMLGYHCDRPEFAHIFLSHWLPGFIFGSLFYLIEEFVCSRLVATRINRTSL